MSWIVNKGCEEVDAMLMVQVLSGYSFQIARKVCQNNWHRHFVLYFVITITSFPIYTSIFL